MASFIRRSIFAFSFLRFTGSFVVTALAAALMVTTADAYDQWNYYAAVDSGTTFDTEVQAAEHMRSFGGERALLTIRKGEVDMGINYARVAWIAPDEPPYYTDDWLYWGAGAPGTYASEGELITAIIDELNNYNCPLIHFEQLPPYATETNYLGLPTRQLQYYEYQHEHSWYDPNAQTWVCLPNSNPPNISHFYRDRTATCPTYYTANVPTNLCVLNYVDHTYRNTFTRSCPNEGTPCDSEGMYDACSEDGNPCNAATGNKTLRELDYSSPAGLELVRNYNSLIGMATWSTRYFAHLITSGTSALGLITGQGYDEPFRNYGGGKFVAYTGSGIEARLIGGEWVVSYPSGARDYFSSAGGAPLRRENPSGQTVTFDYGSDFETYTGPFGHALTLEKASTPLGPQPSKLIQPDGQEILYDYTVDGYLWKIHYPDGTVRQYHHEDRNHPGLVTGITDENGTRFSTYTYDSSRRALTSEHAGGHGKVTLSYAPYSTTVTDAVGTVKTYNFTTSNSRIRKITSLQLDGTTRSYTYSRWRRDNQQRPTQVNDELGINTRFTYDTHHNISRTLAYGTPNARVFNYFYLDETTDRLTKVQSPSTYGTSFKKEIETTYNVDNLPATIERRGYTPAGTAVSQATDFQYNIYGQLTQIDGPIAGAGDITSLTYNECTTGGGCGQLASITNALGHLTTFDSYDANARLLQMTDANNVVTTYTYNLRGWLTSMTQTPPVGAQRVTTYKYDNVGQLETVTAPNGTALTYVYDAAHLLQSVTDNLGNKIEYAYDLNGNLTDEDVKDPLGMLAKAIDYTYDARNRLDTINSAGSITDLLFDALGNLKSETDPNLNTTAHTIDALNRLTDTLDAMSATTAYEYDVNDYLTSVQAPNGAATTYVYDDLGNLLSTTSPDTGTTTYAYDAAGNRLTQTDARGVTTTYTYDALNRLAAISYPDTSLNVTLTYDGGTNQKGRLTSMADATGTTTYSYDVFGNLVQQDTLIDGSLYVTAYAYDAANLLTQITYPSGRTVDYTRNLLGQATQVDTTHDLATQTIASNIAYEPFGPLSGLTFGNALVLTRTFDQQYRLTGQVTGTIQDMTVTLDPASNVDALTDGVVPGLSQTFNQDALHRVTQDAGAYGTKTYTYDSVGNRLTRVHGAATQTLSYTPNSNQLSSHDGLAVTLDAAGNTTADAAQNLAFTYADHNRMSSGSLGGLLQAHYAYNGHGQRAKKTEATGALRTFIYHYGLNGELIGESVYDTGGSLIAERDYLWLDTLALAQAEQTFSGGVPSGSTLVYLHADQLNTPRIASNDTGTIVWRWDADAFGIGAANLDPDGDLIEVNVRLRFPGQYLDEETGLHYNYFRDYDPVTGRYVESDPIGLLGGLNTYVYGGGNPTTSIDPLGLRRVRGRGGDPRQRAIGNPRVGVTATIGITQISRMDGKTNWVMTTGGGLGFTIDMCGPADSACRNSEVRDTPRRPDSWGFTLAFLGFSVENGSFCVHLGPGITIPVAAGWTVTPQ